MKNLFRCNVFNGAHKVSTLSKPGLEFHPGQSKIEKFNEVQITLLLYQHDIGRLQVTVNDVFFVN